MSINPLNDISRVYLEQIASQEVDEGYQPIGKEKESAMYRRAGNLARTSLSSRGKKKEEAQKKSATIVSAITRQKEKERFDRIGQSPAHNEEAKPDYLDFDKDGNEKESMKKALKDKAKQKVEEAKKPNDGNLANNYPPYDKVTRGDVIAGATGKDQMGGKKKKVTKESFSNWRQDLSEVITDIKAEKKITEKKVNNKVVINPNLDLGESVKNLGGQLLEMKEIDILDVENDIFDQMSESEIFLMRDALIEQIVEEVFYECLEEGYDICDIERTLCESLDHSLVVLSEAKVTYGHDTDIKTDRIQKVKSAVKRVGKAVARGVGYAAGAAIRGAKAVGREARAGYERGRGGSSSASTSTGSSASASKTSTQNKPSLLSRIGAKLKSGLKKTIAKGARAVSRGARNVARKMEGGEKKEAPKAAPKAAPKKAEKPSDPWEGSAVTPPRAKAKKAEKPKVKAPARKKRTSKLDTLLADIRSEEAQLDEKTLTSAETKKKEEIVKSMKSKSSDFEKRYPGRGKEVMYATATKMAKKISEQAMEIQPKTKAQQQDVKSQIASQKAKQSAIALKTRELQTLRQTPAGTSVSTFG